MRCETTDDVEEFWERAHAWLATEPVLNSVILTNVAKRRDGAVVKAEPETYVIVYADSTGAHLDGTAAGPGGRAGIVGVAMRTPPFHAYVSAMPADAIEPLTDALLAACPDNDGVTGSTEEAAAVARTWSRRTGCEVRTAMKQRLHSLETVVPAGPVPGEIRLAREADRDLLIEWREAFEMEAGHAPRPSGNAPQAVDLALAEDRAYVWDDGGPVSYVGITPKLAGVVRIAPVYTPPDRRGRGYASAAVAAVSQGALDASAEQCCLYTDLANPTSNKIYAAVGYRPVADISVLKFAGPAPSRQVSQQVSR